jgi:S-DNA-T family DNA segregation ATPase FtsK/SpoIIIE
MARRKLLRLPFLKIKVNQHTVFNLLGFLILGIALILSLSFLKFFSQDNEGRVLYQLNQFLLQKFGGLSLFIPLILILIGTHFFNSKKLKIIKVNITLGLVLIFISLLGIFQSGEYGILIANNLRLDFSSFGAMIILLFTFIMGLILFLNTSVDSFFIFVFNISKKVFIFFKEYFFRNLFTKKPKIKESKDFIEDKKTPLVIAPKKSLELISSADVSSSAVSNKEKNQNKEVIEVKPLAARQKINWVFPPLSILSDISQNEADRGDVARNADIIEKTLDSFGIRARVEEVNPGPTVTQYALRIAEGTKLSKITALANDLALSLATPTGTVRIEAPIPGRSLVGIEIPNLRPQIITLKNLLSQPIFINNPDPLLVPLGLDVAGNPQAASIGKMPHVLIAGATGSGKSVLLNAWISTFLFRTKPEDLRLILVDPKRVELSLYNGIPHLLSEVIVEAKKIISALQWTVSEMENRYKEFARVGARNLESYNNLPNIEKKPYIIFIIDELADLMIFAARDAEDLITRIAQMARATGIHLVLATQRPSVDVITGLMKANIPTRVAFNVSSMIDSRVIIDMPGAEKLLGRGDMLFLPPDQAKPKRIQGPFITEKDVQKLVEFIKINNPPVHYTTEVVEQKVTLNTRSVGGTFVDDGDKDPLFDEVVKLIITQEYASASFLQRKFKIGYARAARLLDQLEAAGYVGPAEGSKPREVIKRSINDDAAINEGQEPI